MSLHRYFSAHGKPPIDHESLPVVWEQYAPVLDDMATFDNFGSKPAIFIPGTVTLEKVNEGLSISYTQEEGLVGFIFLGSPIYARDVFDKISLTDKQPGKVLVSLGDEPIKCEFVREHEGGIYSLLSTVILEKYIRLKNAQDPELQKALENR